MLVKALITGVALV